jgi:hypothetical protein
VIVDVEGGGRGYKTIERAADFSWWKKAKCEMAGRKVDAKE